MPLNCQDQRLRPGAVTRIAPVFRDDVACYDTRSRLEVWRQSAGDAKTQNALATLPNRCLKRAPELYLPTAANHGYPGSGHDASFKSETRYGHKTRPDRTTQ